MSDFTTIDEGGAAASRSIVLYLDLEPGRHADLEAVARASLAFVYLIKEIAYVTDPSLEIRIELVSGTEGSLSLNSIIRSIRASDHLSRRNLIAVAIAAGTWFTLEAGSWGVGRVLDNLTTEEQRRLAPADIEEIVRRVEEVRVERIGAAAAQSVYRELDREPGVRAVGVANQPGDRPSALVPRGQFRELADEVFELEEAPERRQRISVETLTLVSPVLIAGSTRRWKFRGVEGEFGATMRDPVFMDRVRTGQTGVPLQADVRMVVELETIERRDNNVWIVVERNIREVRDVVPPPEQPNLLNLD